ncbi:MAG: methylated-DNA--protein-cysteine methyltransferase [Lysobacterales bacterium]|nr:MAG: methylated-DNA--protein-cysteine methyltransferase [Xanthomonadales bacterium]
MAELRRARIESPLGVLELRADGEHLIGLAFLGEAAAWPRPRAGVLALAAAQLRAYFRGALRSFELPLAPAGSAFQLRVWRALGELPYGARIAYGELARRIGQPKAARAVGAALAANPLPIVIPCHRVIAAGGALGGYSGPPGAKTWLLGHESRSTAS